MRDSVCGMLGVLMKISRRQRSAESNGGLRGKCLYLYPAFLLFLQIKVTNIHNRASSDSGFFLLLQTMISEDLAPISGQSATCMDHAKQL